jgi:hypothetical protein
MKIEMLVTVETGHDQLHQLRGFPRMKEVATEVHDLLGSGREFSLVGVRARILKADGNVTQWVETFK